MEGIRGTTHPLDTPLILDCVFKNLRLSDLKTCRQVSRHWHETATLAMLRVANVELDNDSIPKFLELIQSELSTFENFPFAKNYELRGVHTNYPEFWAFCGNSIKSLDLSHIEFESADIFRRIIFQSCSNLENLVICYVDVAGSEKEDKPLVWIQPQFPQNLNLKQLRLDGQIQLGEISFLELLSYFPSLEQIEVHTWDDSSRIFQSLAIVRKHDPQCWKIKNISFDIGDLKQPESDLQFLFDDISLEALIVRRVVHTEHISFVRNIVSEHAATLKTLKLEGSETGGFYDFPYDTMLEKVVDFCLEGTLITSLSFLGYLPNLRKLELSRSTYSLETDSLEGPLNHCTELILEFRERAAKAENILPLLRCVPNVKKLRVIKCSNKLLTGICKSLQKLVCLELPCSEVDDCGISGLDKETVNRINKEGCTCPKLRRRISLPRESLFSLKNLKWFRYEPYISTQNHLGLCAALCGVQELPQLQHLKVKCKELHPIWDHLHDQFPWRDPY